MEIAGTACRTWGHFETLAIAPYAIQSILILIAPTLFAATIYMGLSRIVRSAHAEACSPLRVRFLTLTFVLGDVTSFMVQSTGGGLQAKSDPDAQTSGLWIAMGGQVIQIALLAGFIWLVILIQHRMLASVESNIAAAARQSSYKVYVLVATSALILVRSIIRIAEFAMGKDGYLLTNEWPLLILDLSFMALLMLVMGVVYMPNPETSNEDVETKAEAAAVRH